MKHARRAVTMLELLAATVIAAALLTAVAQVAVLSAAQHVAAERRLLAMSEAQQIVELVSAMPFAEITADALRQIKLPPAAVKALPQAALAIDVVEEVGPPRAKRIRVEINWETQPGVPARPVRLTTWRFAGGES